MEIKLTEDGKDWIKAMIEDIETDAYIATPKCPCWDIYAYIDGEPCKDICAVCFHFFPDDDERCPCYSTSKVITLAFLRGLLIVQTMHKEK